MWTGQATLLPPPSPVEPPPEPLPEPPPEPDELDGPALLLLVDELDPESVFELSEPDFDVVVELVEPESLEEELLLLARLSVL